MNSFSIVTPSYNSEVYLKECLYSVLNQQGNFNIEHIIIDGKSTDGTIEILKQFEKDINTKKIIPNCKNYQFKWISEKDNGMYEAIIKGFEISSGNIIAWINADDKYQEEAFRFVSETFENNPNIRWVKGITDYIDANGNTKKGQLYTYNQKLISKGIYGTVAQYIQQDSVFWKRELWENINSKEISKYKLAGDFRLWQLFAQKTRLYTFNKHLSYFRKHPGQLSSNVEKYLKEAEKTVSYSSTEKMIYKNIYKIDRFFKKVNYDHKVK